MKNKVTKSYIKQLVREALQETTFVDPKGRAVDLARGDLSPRNRIQAKYYEPLYRHPNIEFRKKLEKLRIKSAGIPDLEDYDPLVDFEEPRAPTPEEKAEAKKQYQFFAAMANHQDERIRKSFNSENMRMVNQAISLADVYPPEVAPPQLSDDEEYEQGIYDEFGGSDGTIDVHNFPYQQSPSIGQYREIFNNLLNKAVKRVQDAYDSGEKSQTELAYIASQTPGLQQSWDRFGYDLEDLNFIPELAVEKVVGKDNMEDLGYAGRLEESKASKVTKSYIRQLVKEEIRKGKK